MFRCVSVCRCCIASRHKSLLGNPNHKTISRHTHTHRIIMGKMLHRHLTKIYDFTHTNNIPFCNKIMIIWLNENWTFSAIESLIDWLFVYHIQVVFRENIDVRKVVQHYIVYGRKVWLGYFHYLFWVKQLRSSFSPGFFFGCRYLMDEWFTQKLLAPMQKAFRIMDIDLEIRAKAF